MCPKQDRPTPGWDRWAGVCVPPDGWGVLRLPHSAGTVVGTCLSAKSRDTWAGCDTSATCGLNNRYWTGPRSRLSTIAHVLGPAISATAAPEIIDINQLIHENFIVFSNTRGWVHYITQKEGFLCQSFLL